MIKEVPEAGGTYARTVIVAQSAGLNAPLGLAVGTDGTVYVSDTGNNRVLKEVPAQDGSYTQSTVVGGLDYPIGVAVDPDGAVYIADAHHDRVVMETPDGNGDYTQSMVGTGLLSPWAVAVGISGRVYIADTFHRRVLVEHPDGGTGFTQSTVPINGLIHPAGLAWDPSGELYVSDYNGNQAFQVTDNLDGSFSQKTVTTGLNNPIGIAVDGDGKILIADYGNTRVLAVTQKSDGSFDDTTILGGFQQVAGVAVDGNTGSVFLVDYGANSVVKQIPGTNGGYTLSTVADSSNGLHSPVAARVGPDGSVYIVDETNNRVVREVPNGSGYAQSLVVDGLNTPVGLAVDSAGVVYVADWGNNRVLKETPGSGAAYTTSTVGTGLTHPLGVAVDGTGDVYIADGGNNRVLKETPSGSGSYTQATIVSSINHPYDLVVAQSGILYIAKNRDNQVINEIPDGSGGYTEGTVADSSGGLSDPASLAIDANDNLYVADQYSVRKFLVGKATSTPTATATTTPSDTPTPASPYIYCGDAKPCVGPKAFLSAYNVTGLAGLADASNTTIALLDYGSPVLQSDLKGFVDAANSEGGSNFRIPAFNSTDPTGANGVQFWKVDYPLCGVHLDQDKPDPSRTINKQNVYGETALDVEYAHAMAPNSHINVYLINGALGLTCALRAAINNGSTTVVSSSIADPQAVYTTLSAFGAETESAANAHITLLVASGDTGTEPFEPTAELPSVVAVGGTDLEIGGGTPIQVVKETAWNQTGNACSSTFLGLGKDIRPSWQQGVNAASCTDGRAIPDISAMAESDQYVGHTSLTYVDGKVNTAGGTSVAAPLWAGMMADLSHYLCSQGHDPYGLCANRYDSIGFIGPRLYQLANNPATYARDYHDIQECDAPDKNGLCGGRSVGAGWDQLTGWGSPNLTHMAQDWTATLPPTLKLLPATGAITPGSTVHMFGSGFKPGETIAVYYGTEFTDPYAACRNLKPQQGVCPTQPPLGVADVVTDEYGYINRDLPPIRPDAPVGTYTVSASGVSSGSSSATFDIVQTAVVDHDNGGSLQTNLQGGWSVAVSFPPGAVSGNTTISAADAPSPVPTPPAGYTPESVPVNLTATGPDGSQFHQPVTLTFSYPPGTNVDLYKLRIDFYDTAAGTWVELSKPQVDTIHRTITAQTYHFTLYGVFLAPTDVCTGSSCTSPPDPGAATPELGSGELLITGLSPILFAVYMRRRGKRRVRPDPGAKV